MKIWAGETSSYIEHDINEAALERMAAEAYENFPFTHGVAHEDITFGIEAEFYLNDDDPEQAVRYLIEKIMRYYTEQIHYLPMSIEDEKDPNCWYVERDLSLDRTEYGFELVSPAIRDIKKLPFYLNMVMDSVRAVGYTEKECGLHLHLSSPSMEKMDLVKGLLFMDNRGTLSGWSNRNHYAKDILRVFRNTDLDIFRKHHHEMSRYYNVSLIEGNHVELRSFGGKEYELKKGQILSDIRDFLEVYRIACRPELEQDLYQDLIQEHILKQKNKDVVYGIVTRQDALELARTIHKAQGYDDFTVSSEIALSLLEEERLVPRKRFREAQEKLQEADGKTPVNKSSLKAKL